MSQHGLREAISLKEIMDLTTDELDAAYKVAGKRMVELNLESDETFTAELLKEAIIREEFLKAAVRMEKRNRNESEKQVALLNMQLEQVKKQIK